METPQCGIILWLRTNSLGRRVNGERPVLNPEKRGSLTMPAVIDVNEQPHVSTPPGWVQTVSDLIHEFFVDLLAILLPGMVFTLFVVVLLIASGACLLDAFRPEAQPVTPLGDLLKGQFNASVVWLFAIFGYVVGGTFFRQDPKLPDMKSIKRILKGSPRGDRKRSEVQLGQKE